MLDNSINLDSISTETKPISRFILAMRQQQASKRDKKVYKRNKYSVLADTKVIVNRDECKVIYP